MNSETIGLLTGFFGLLIAAGTVVVGIYGLLKWLDKRVTWVHDAKTSLTELPGRLDEQDKQIAAIVADLRPNGGKSMKDAANRMERNQIEMNRMLLEHLRDAEQMYHRMADLSDRVQRLEQPRWQKLSTIPGRIGRTGTETETQP